MGDMADFINDDTVEDGDGYYEPSCSPFECPICGGPIHLVPNGKHGSFYGCNKYPKCNGSRSIDKEDL
jgi:ssDNA-binding Zn-finger/Zn-ribbon topoisomerase 1